MLFPPETHGMLVKKKSCNTPEPSEREDKKLNSFEYKFTLIIYLENGTNSKEMLKLNIFLYAVPFSLLSEMLLLLRWLKRKKKVELHFPRTLIVPLCCTLRVPINVVNSCITTKYLLFSRPCLYRCTQAIQGLRFFLSILLPSRFLPEDLSSRFLQLGLPY